MGCSMPGFPVFHYLPESAQIYIHWVGDAIQPSYPLCLLLLPPSIFPSIRVFSSELDLHIRQPKYWSFSFSFSISSSSKYSGLISFRIKWFDLLCCPRDSQESSLTQQFKIIISLVLSLLYGPTLTSIQDYWENHIFDHTSLCQQSDVCFLIHCLGLS